MKKTLLFAVLLLSAGFIMAQDGGQRPPIEERVKMVMEKITPALSLDKEQTPKTDSIYTDYYRAMEKFRATLDPGTRPDRSQFEKFVIERDEKLKKVFTEAQFRKFKEEVEPTLRPQRSGGTPPSGGQN